MFFDMQPDLAGRPSYISDSNGRLMTTYSAVRDDLDEVLRTLVLYQIAHDKRGKDFYYEARDQIPSDPSKLAAWMIFMNKTCFNGLYRVNKAGGFNVPHGKYEDPRILDTELLTNCSAALASCFVMHGDFREILKECEAGDFVYLDPPYIPLSKTSAFVSYTPNKFGAQDQEDLAEAAKELDARGVFVILSGSGSLETTKLYEQSFAIVPVRAARAISAKTPGRGEVVEYIIHNSHRLINVI